MTRRPPFAWACRAAENAGLDAREVEHGTMWRACPTCGVAEGTYCVSQSGITAYTPHIGRVRRAIRALSKVTP